ncbi:helix-turn-helix domain-containing protein [Streptomyces sp. NPDC059897]|uniref:helix-turn-helix domain-containing protein n=1 Tax=Streptomyces sp. NPDC059897 TaxID=3346994 RepID=UPI003668D145
MPASGWQQRGTFVAGLLSEAVCMRGENTACVEVRLSPLIARAMLGVSPVDLDGSTIALDDVWGRQGARIREQLDDATSWEDRFALTDALLARQRGRGPTVDPEVAWGWERIVASRGRVRVEDLAIETGWSRKRLWGRFRSQIGLPPKRVARLVRFHHAAHRLASGESVSQIAAECGYADQSHLHREVRAFTAMAPTTLADTPGLKADDVAWAGRGVGDAS